jgi:hypothetical protein
MGDLEPQITRYRAGSPPPHHDDLIGSSFEVAGGEWVVTDRVYDVYIVDNLNRIPTNKHQNYPNVLWVIAFSSDNTQGAVFNQYSPQHWLDHEWLRRVDISKIQQLAREYVERKNLRFVPLLPL